MIGQCQIRPIFFYISIYKGCLTFLLFFLFSYTIDAFVMTPCIVSDRSVSHS